MEPRENDADMPLEKTNVVDATGIEKETGTVCLSLLDSWDWSDEQLHLRALQDKLNSYLEFIETGQVWELCPTRTGSAVRIDIIARFPLVPIAEAFLKLAEITVAEAGVQLTWSHYVGKTQ